MTLKDDVQTYIVNPNCNCVTCFIKSTMEETGGTYEDVVASLEELAGLGMAIVCKDNNGEITDIIRAKSKKEYKKILAMRDKEIVEMINDGE